MKKWKFKIDPISSNLFFPKERIDRKSQIIKILLETTRYILNNLPCQINNRGEPEIILLVDKMSRLFFISEYKTYSIVFPFKINYDTDGNKFTIYYENHKIDSRLLSNMITIISDSKFEVTSLLGFIDFLDGEDIISEDDESWFILKELILKEDGYIRYDIDSNGYEIAKEKGAPDRHPLHHLDLFYSNNSTFKIGLKNELTTDHFIDLLNIKTDCKYIDN